MNLYAYDIIEIYNPEHQPHDDDQSMNDSVRTNLEDPRRCKLWNRPLTIHSLLP